MCNISNQLEGKGYRYFIVLVVLYRIVAKCKGEEP